VFAPASSPLVNTSQSSSAVDHSMVSLVDHADVNHAGLLCTLQWGRRQQTPALQTPWEIKYHLQRTAGNKEKK